jgi:hypothetical protein
MLRCICPGRCLPEVTLALHATCAWHLHVAGSKTAAQFFGLYAHAEELALTVSCWRAYSAEQAMSWCWHVIAACCQPG